MRFCSRCGFSMEGVMHLLASGGMLPVYQAEAGEKQVSPRRRGVKQGALLMLLGALIVPIFGVMSGFAPGRLENVFAFFAAMSWRRRSERPPPFTIAARVSASHATGKSIAAKNSRTCATLSAGSDHAMT